MASADKDPATKRRETSAHPSDGSLDERLERLEERLKGAQNQQKNQEIEQDGADNVHKRAGIAQAFRLSSEFIAGVVVGAGIGYLVDTFFGTAPWGMIFFFLLGFAAAVLNVMRAAGMVAESGMRLRPAQELHKRQLEGETDETGQK